MREEKIGRNYSTKDVSAWQFEEVELPPEWIEHFGELAKPFRMLISGDSGQGKTEYIMQLTKMLAMHHGKVHYNNVEQGKSKTLKEAFYRQGLDELPGGKWMLGGKDLSKWDNYIAKVQRPNSGRVLAIDSITYWGLTYQQIKWIHERFPNKDLIFIAYAVDPMLRKLNHLMDIKVKVENYEANVISRFGGNKPWIIWPEGYEKATGKKASGQGSLFQ